MDNNKTHCSKCTNGPDCKLDTSSYATRPNDLTCPYFKRRDEKMKVTILREAGYEEAMLGLSLSFNADPSRMPARAAKLAKMDPASGEVKFLEAIAVWLDVTAPRYWWSQFDTYRAGVSKQSESTMHTLMRTVLEAHHFEGGIDETILGALNNAISTNDFGYAKRHLPESFLQRRIVTTNYKTILHIIRQRHDHKLTEWQDFCLAMRGLKYRHYIFGGDR